MLFKNISPCNVHKGLLSHDSRVRGSIMTTAILSNYIEVVATRRTRSEMD